MGGYVGDFSKLILSVYVLLRIGLALALFSAIFQALGSFITKYMLGTYSPLQLARIVSIGQLFCVTVIVTVYGDFVRSGDVNTVLSIIVVCIINGITAWSVPLALQKSDLGVVIPMMSYVPVFTGVFAVIFLGEVPNIIGLGGVCCVVLGSFLLNVKKGISFGQIITSPWSNIGSRIMLGNTILWSGSNVFIKTGIAGISPYIYALCISIGITVLLTCAVLYTRYRKVDIYRSLPVALSIGSMKAGSRITMLMSLTSLLTVYFFSIKRMSSIIAVVLGYIYLGEKNIGGKMLGSICMLGGVVLILFS